jgi:hypothetical protein
MEIETNVQQHVATPSAAPAAPSIPAGPATQVSESHAQPDTSGKADLYKPEPRLSPENIKERVARFKKGPEKAPKAPETPPGSPDPKAAAPAPKAPEKQAKEPEKPAAAAPKAGEQPPVTPPAAGEYAAPKTFKAAGKDYEFPKWAQEAMKSPELEKEIAPLFSKVLAFDHVQQRAKELGERYVQLQGGHEELVGGIKDLRTIYADAVQSGNLIGLDDFFGKLQIPIEVILNYAAQHAKLAELPPEQQQLIMGQIQARRDARDMSLKTQTLESSQVNATAKIIGLEMDAALKRPDVAPMVQQFDSSPGRKPGDFFEAVRRHGELHWYQTKQVLHPAEAVKQVISMYGLTGAPASGVTAPAANGQPAAAAPAPQTPPTAPQAPGVAVVPAAHRNVGTIPGVQGTSGSPMQSKPKTVEDLKRIRKERFG